MKGRTGDPSASRLNLNLQRGRAALFGRIR